MAYDGAARHRHLRSLPGAGIHLTLCPDCRTSITEAPLSCPECHCLLHAAELEALAAKAQAAANGADFVLARSYWAESLKLLPEDTIQYRSIKARIEKLDEQIRAAEADGSGRWKKAAGIFGPIGLLLWKLKALLFGLAKFSTLISMFVSFGFYWSIYGWRLAAGLIISIYIHEMGHVLELRKFGIPAGAPMFIPGFGAFIQLRGVSLPAVQDARIGLAGPIFGLAAAAVSLCTFYAAQDKIWAAIAYFGAVVNLFNLIPIWQLDGGRGFHSLMRWQRGGVLAIALSLWLLTSESMLLLIALGAGYRLFTKDAAQEPDHVGFAQYAGLLVTLTTVAVLTKIR
jgi:Zn-dependent protease